ncbi:MAG: glycosyltransferase, partial [Gaiellaceae bacterium]
VDLDSYRFNGEARVLERSTMNVPGERLVLLFVGDNFERKGLDRAIGAVARSRQNVELWVAGGGVQDTYRELARSLGVADRTRFLGRVPKERLTGVYSAADVFVLPSRQDAWGHPTIEAMAAGRVALVSEYSGSEEAVESGVTGFVLDGGGSSEEIAALLDGPLGRQESRQAIGDRAVEAVTMFDRRVVAPRFRAAHHRAAELRRTRVAAT